MASVDQQKHSISKWLPALKAGDEQAAQYIWDRYSGFLVKSAKSQLAKLPRGVQDEEDIAQSVFSSVCRGAAAGRLERMKSREDLFWLLLAVTRKKVVDYMRHQNAQKRGPGRVQSEVELAGDADGRDAFSLDKLVGNDRGPDFILMIEEQGQRLLGQLRDARLRRIARLRLEGYRVEEIADQMSIGRRSVERKLRLIRTTWSKDLACAD
jgi:RNA polymerase sigma factor (sigma-70 family)